MTRLKEGRNPLIDGDTLIYRCGFAVKEGEPVENSLFLLRNSVNKILDEFDKRDYNKLYLTGSNNFRDSVAVTLPYKGNRSPTQRPIHYKELREFAVNSLGAEIIDGEEADDALGKAQWAAKDKSTCIVGIDKDLDMIPGWHYNPVKKKRYYMTLDKANRNFYLQLLTGDRTDNIRGIDGIGPVTANKLLTNAGSSIADWILAVEREYEKQYAEGWRSVLEEHKLLLWIKRE